MSPPDVVAVLFVGACILSYYLGWRGHRAHVRRVLESRRKETRS